MEKSVSQYCQGEVCTICKQPAQQKMRQEIFDDMPIAHGYSAYLCQSHFEDIVMPYKKKKEMPEVMIMFDNMLQELKHLHGVVSQLSGEDVRLSHIDGRIKAYTEVLAVLYNSYPTSLNQIS